MYNTNALRSVHQVGDIQHFSFRHDDSPPFYDLNCPKLDETTDELKEAPKKVRGSRTPTSFKWGPAWAPRQFQRVLERACRRLLWATLTSPKECLTFFTSAVGWTRQRNTRFQLRYFCCFKFKKLCVNEMLASFRARVEVFLSFSVPVLTFAARKAYGCVC